MKNSVWMLWAVLIGGVVGLAIMHGCGGFHVPGFLGHKPADLPPAPAAPGAAASWGLFKYMALSLFSTALLMVIAGIVGASFFPPLAPLAASGFKIMVYAVIIGAVPFALEWAGDRASLPVEIGMFIAVGLGAVVVVLKLWQAKQLHGVHKEIKAAKASGDEPAAYQLEKSAARIAAKAKRILPGKVTT